MVIVHILLTLALTSKPKTAHAQWVPIRPLPVRPWGPVYPWHPPVAPYRPFYPVPYRPVYVAPMPYGWAWNPYAWQPGWWAWHSTVIVPWAQIGWAPYIAPGLWQCVAFNAYGGWFTGVSPIANQAAYNALWSCGANTWQAAGCYVPPGYCQYYP